MSDVKRYNFFTGPGEGRNADFVMAADFDAALARHVSDLKLRDRELEIAAEHHSELQEQLSALREELAAEKKWYDQEIDEAQKHRVAAEQRNAPLVELLRTAERLLPYCTSSSAPGLIDHIKHALKSTQPGASNG